MADVVNFSGATADRQIWVCVCGCSTWELNRDGTAQCAGCDGLTEAEAGGWFTAIEDGPERDPDLPGPVADVQGNGSVEFARRRMARLAEGDDVRMLVVVRDSSAVSLWRAETSTEEGLRWMRERLDDAREML